MDKVAAGFGGKTSVPDMLSLLASSAQGNLRSAISELSGLSSVLTYGIAEELRLGVTMQRPGGIPLEYQLALRPRGIGYVISEETLRMLPAFYIGSNESQVKYWDSERGAFFLLSH